MEFKRKKITDLKEIEIDIKIENNQTVTAEDYFQKAEIYLENKEYDKAILDYTKAIEINNSYASAYFKRACTYYCQNQLQKAKTDYDKAVSFNLQIEVIYNYRADLPIIFNDVKSAINDYNTLLQLNPNDYNAYYYRGISYEKNGDINLAINDYSKAIELNPDLDNAYINRGRIYSKSNQLEKAKIDFNSACRINPNRKNECDSCIQGHEKLQEIDKQLQIKEKILTQQIELIKNTLQTGNSFFEKKEYRRALSYYSEVIKIDSKQAEAYLKRGLCYWYLNDKNKASKDFEIATSLNPDYGKLLLGLGIAGVLGDLINKYFKK